MKAKLKISPGTKIFVIFCTLIAIGSIGLEKWLKHQHQKHRTADYMPWKLANVDSGSSFTVQRHDKTKNIELCGVKTSGDKAKNFLQTVINKGDGTIELEKVKDGYEAWVLLKPDFEQQIHLNTWVIERGYARRDQKNSDKCLEPDNLKWAEDLAKEEKLGMWQDK